MDAVYWYSVTPKDDISTPTAPANIICTFHARIKGISSWTCEEVCNIWGERSCQDKGPTLLIYGQISRVKIKRWTVCTQYWATRYHTMWRNVVLFWARWVNTITYLNNDENVIKIEWSVFNNALQTDNSEFNSSVTDLFSDDLSWEEVAVTSLWIWINFSEFWTSI